MTETRVVLAPLDGSRAATAVLSVARTLAHAVGASLHALHAKPSGGEVPADPLSALGLDEADAGDLVIDARTGDPAETILRAADEWRTTFVVLCAHTGVHDAGCALGPVAARVAEATPHPVLVVPPTRGATPWKLRTILLPHDGSPAVASALGPAFDLAQRAGASVWVLHVASPRAPVEHEPGALRSPRYVDQQQHEWPEWSREFVERLAVCALGLPKPLRLALGHGEPASVIASFAAAHDVDLVVVCSRCVLRAGRSSVLDAVLEQARLPVLVLRCA